MSTDIAGIKNGTPERFVPTEMRGQLVEAEHMARYLWAARFSQGRRVLDAGCGVGYGAAMLDRAGARQVTAVDIAPPVIEVARQSVPDTVRCDVGDLTSLAYPAASFDLVVCFEVIEHVEDPDAVMDELKRVMSPDALLLISSPNRDHYVPGNPHHRHEYLPVELRTALESRFSAICMLRQHTMLSSVISASEDGSQFTKIDVHQLVEPQDGEEIYSIAIAGTNIPDVGKATVALTQLLEMRDWFERDNDQRLLLENQADALCIAQEQQEDRLEALRQLANAERLLAERENEMALLRSTIAIKEQEAVVSRQDTSIAVEETAEISSRLARSAATIDAMSSSTSWRITSPLRRTKSFLGTKR
jgi:2-polyprenyl-3-methyl-5-hydroxy-6-metoxy-1,4-benzoquinol methylase